jgi:CRAL/TRIO domain
LLQFLRAKKFLNAEAFKSYEKLQTNYEAYPKWFKNLSLEDERMRELLDAGYLVPLKERDSNGCRVLLSRPRVFDTKKFNEDDIYRSFFWIANTLLEEPETQVSGMVLLVDYKDAKLDYISLFSLMDMKHFASCIQSAYPLRVKKTYWVNFPAFGVRIAEIFRSFLSSKLNERSIITSDDKLIAENFDARILPAEYGGETPLSEMIASFKVLAEQHKGSLKRIDEQSIDLSRVQGYEAVESFKKLEID